MEQLGIPAVLLFCTVLALFWLGIAFTMPSPPQLRSVLLTIEQVEGKQADALHQYLVSQPGVLEVTLITDKCLAHVKVDNQQVNAQQLTKIAQEFTIQST